MLVNDKPLVSVCMSSYNNAKYIVEALESVKNQSYSNIELIIIDDCSKDNSVDIIETWLQKSDIPHKLVKHDKNEGVCRVANDMILHSRGKYMSIIASDDVFVHEKLSVQVAEFESLDESYALIYSDVHLIDEDSRLKSNTLLNSKALDFRPVEGDVFISLLQKNFIPGISTLIRIDALRDLGGFDEDLFYEDWDMWLRISTKYKIHYSDFIGSKYRTVSTSMWNTRSTNFYDTTVRLLKKHLGYSPESDKIIYDHIREQAELLYMRGAKSATGYLKEVWDYYRAPSLGVMYAMSAIGLPYTLFNRLRRLRS